MKKAALINAFGKYSKIFLTLLVNAILSRILSADDYGVVAVITVFSTLFTTLSDMGFGAAIVQKKDLNKSDIDNIYSFTVYISVFLMLIFILCSFPISSFFENDVYIGLGVILSVSLLFNSLNMVPNGILSRDKKFWTISIRTIVVYFIASLFTIFLALLGFSYYALALESVFTAFFTFIWNYFSLDLRFSIFFDFKSIKKVLNYSGFQFAFNIVNYLSRNLDNLLTGRFMGSAQLGYYNKAYTLMLFPVNNLSGVITPVLHSILSDFQHNYLIIYKQYLRVVKLLLCLGAFIAPFCYLGASEIIDILYGQNWEQTISCFQILSFAIISQMLNTSSGGVFQAIGNTRLLFINGIVNTIVTVIAIIIGVFYGKTILNLSICIAIAYIIHSFLTFFILIKLGFRFKLSKFFFDILPDIFVLVVMIIAVVIYPLHIANILLSILLKGIFLLIIFANALFFTGEFRIFIQLFRKEK
ncbi:lipopolysaccharide biosynthesis protein [Streptococcus equinus]|uniref:lipopolysaccharide biosynthesis protein n=1 Tax=Streptococcus equinus TaxID=1335 RepID=UPI00040C1F25|nr:lipopolysaccharide biosynthesis protein [Streptococcus equinus]